MAQCYALVTLWWGLLSILLKTKNKFVLKIGLILGKQAALYNTPPV